MKGGEIMSKEPLNLLIYLVVLIVVVILLFKLLAVI